MTIELGISHFTCDCGAMICPPGTISTKGRKQHAERIDFPPAPDKITDDMFLPEDVYDDIQAGKHDENEALVRFKGKTRKACITTLRDEYSDAHAADVITLKAEADETETALKAHAKNMTRTDDDDGISFDAERFEAVVEGNDANGRAVCPGCGKELCSWRK